MIEYAAQLVMATVFGFGAVVEMEHCRTYLKAKNYLRVVFTGIAALACLYISSEGIVGDWPTL